MNYLSPLKEIMSMHCSANIGQRGTWPSSSAFPGRARRPFRPTPAAADRRRRAWLGRGRGLQLRRRLLCQGDPPVAGGRARDLWDDAPVWDGPGKRRSQQDEAAARPGDGSLTENTRAGYPLTHIPNARRHEWAGTRRTSCSYLRRLRGPPSRGEAHPRTGQVPLPHRVHRQGGGDRAGHGKGASGDLQHLLRRAFHGPAAGRLRKAPAGEKISRHGAKCPLARQHGAEAEVPTASARA